MLAALALTACAPAGFPDVDPAPATRAAELPAPEAPADPTTPGPAPPACGPVRGPGDHVHTVEVGGLERKFLVHVPPGTTGPIPVVIVWHALLLTGFEDARLPSIRELTGFDAHADRRGFVTVYPEGIGNSWNAGECCVEAKKKNVDDVGFARAILDALGQDACVDPKRVYSTGFSNGGFLSHRLACELGDRFAAIASVSGTLGVPAETCRPPSPLSVLQIHGTEDELVPFAGGPPKIPFGSHFGTFASVSATMAHWEGRDGCTGASETILKEGTTTCQRRRCAGGSEVALCTVETGGHQWPGSEPLPAMGKQTRDIDATARIVDFLLSHAK